MTEVFKHIVKLKAGIVLTRKLGSDHNAKTVRTWKNRQKVLLGLYRDQVQLDQIKTILSSVHL